MQLQQRIAAVQDKIAAAALAAGRRPEEITLCAATKVQTHDTIRAAIAAGVQVCGENRVQELSAHLACDAYVGARAVHFIGHLQTNKVNKVVGRVDLIHSVDAPHLLRCVALQADKLGLRQDILLQVNLAGEASKGGCPPQQLPQLLELARELPGVRLRGLMAIPPIALHPQDNCAYFCAMHQLFVDIRGKMTDNQGDMDCLSMGMSGDFEHAIAQGATLVRVGTALFGPRTTPGVMG